MPFFRAGSRNIYFAHVPKCGGTTVEHTLTASGVELSFLDERFGLHNYTPWNRSSPQHLTDEDRGRLFARDFFEFEFAIMRNPVNRFLSAFNHQRRRIGVFVSFEKFLGVIEKRNRTHGDFFGYRYDNHFVPGARFCNERTKIFLIENGMDRCLKTVSGEIGVQLKETRTKNVRGYAFTDSDDPLRRAVKKAFAKDSPSAGDLTTEQTERLEHLYKEDYERFGYDLTAAHR